MLISQEYAELNRQMHERPEYGIEGQKYAEIVRDMCNAYGTLDVLDYGCGKQTLRAKLGWDIRGYDPALPGLDAKPEPADIVACTDVLEHIEPAYLDTVIADLRRCTRKVALLVIATQPAIKLLPDGTNPHKIVEPWQWWLPRLVSNWKMTNFQDHGKRFLFIGETL